MYSKKQREQILAEFSASGLSAHAFCRRSGISRGTLQAWQQREEAEAAEPRRDALFARVRIAPGVATAVPVEVHVGRARVVVPPGADPKHVRVLLELLGAFA